MLASGGVQEIFVLCCAHADQITQYIEESRWSSLPGVRVRPIVAANCQSTGDALRSIYTLNYIQSDFILVSGDVVSNMNIANALKIHKAKREADKSTIMTMVFKQASPSHRTRSKQDDIVVGFDRQSQELLCYENTKKNMIKLASDLFGKHPSVQIRYDLIDCHIDICSPEVLALFHDNFDFGDLRTDFISDIMSSDILDYKLSTYVLQGEYAARVKDLRTYNSVSKDIIHRWTFPMVPDNNFMCNTTYTMSRQMIYKERKVRFRACNIGEETVVGKDTEVGDGSDVAHTIIGRNVKIGNNVKIRGAFIWDNVVIEDNAVITECLLCEGATIGAGASVGRGAIVSFNVVVGAGTIVEPFTKLTLGGLVALESDNDEFEGKTLTAPIALGAGGCGEKWILHNGAFNELYPRGDDDIQEPEVIEDPTSVDPTGCDDPPTGGISDLEKFRGEVAATVRRGINEKVSTENIVLEINGLKFAFDKSFGDCASAALPALLDVPNRASLSQKDFIAGLSKRIQFCSNIFSKFLPDEDGQVDFIFVIQDLCDEQEPLKKVVKFILHLLYDADVLSEEAILSWASELEEEDTPENQSYLKQCAELINWLKEAEEDSDEDEDDDDDHNSNSTNISNLGKRARYQQFVWGLIVPSSSLSLDTPTQTFVRTKIVCTIGPKTMSVDMLVKLIETGMSVCRMNFSHGTHEYHGNVIKNLRAAVEKTGKGCALMLDTKGPEIRTGKLEGGTLELAADSEIIVDTNNTVPGNAKRISIDYKGLVDSVKVGGHILIADGVISFSILSVNKEEGVNNNSVLGDTKNVHLPGAVVTLPAVSEKDIGDIKFGIEQGVDFIAASFIRKAEDVNEIRDILGENGKNIQIIAKIENEEGILNFNEILEASDGIMVARGDLGVEVNMEKIFVAQKMIVSKCNAAGKPVITATQMLESMIKAPRPTRAECTDVANAVLDGTDCVMLSGETASGDYPIEAVDIMAKICREAELVESSTDYHTLFAALKLNSSKPITIAETVASYAVATAIDLKADIIITLTETGLTTRLISKYRPPIPIFSITSWEYTIRHLLATRGVIPILVDSLMGTDKLIEHCLDIAMKQGLAKVGSRVVIVSGVMEGVPGKTNSLRVLTVGETIKNIKV
eukprot:gene12112-14168_t